MSKFIVLVSPRSGSFLACQLLEQYLINKYPNYAKSPCYELYTRAGSGLYSLTYSPANGLEIQKKKVGAHTSREKLELIKKCDSEGVNFVAKVSYKNIEAINWYRENGYQIIATLRRDIESQITSYHLGQKSGIWHNYSKTGNNLNFGNSKFVPLDFYKGSSSMKLDEIARSKCANSISTHTRRIEEIGPDCMVYLEDFQDDYDQFYLALGLTDFKQYVPNYDFIVSKKTGE